MPFLYCAYLGRKENEQSHWPAAAIKAVQSVLKPHDSFEAVDGNSGDVVLTPRFAACAAYVFLYEKDKKASSFDPKIYERAVADWDGNRIAAAMEAIKSNKTLQTSLTPYTALAFLHTAEYGRVIYCKLEAADWSEQAGVSALDSEDMDRWAALRDSEGKLEPLPKGLPENGEDDRRRFAPWGRSLPVYFNELRVSSDMALDTLGCNFRTARWLARAGSMQCKDVDTSEVELHIKKILFKAEEGKKPEVKVVEARGTVPLKMLERPEITTALRAPLLEAPKAQLPLKFFKDDEEPGALTIFKPQQEQDLAREMQALSLKPSDFGAYAGIEFGCPFCKKKKQEFGGGYGFGCPYCKKYDQARVHPASYGARLGVHFGNKCS